ncbi:MAG: hypothetical protein FWD69_04275 [Polyangiaceae bacterium]|nr:hypothetical protein [Polyangiaceae bacterium]
MARALAELTALDLEVTNKFIRVPLERQLSAELATHWLPLRSIDQYVRGASRREAMLTAMKLTSSKRARIIVRSTELVLAPWDAPVLDDRDLDRLEATLRLLANALKLARRKAGTLLRSDVSNALHAGLDPAMASASSVGDISMHRVRACVDEHRESSGLTWVPKLVRALGGLAARDRVHAQLFRGARAGELELRPESGMGRLSEEDAALCPSGPQGSRLSWVRRIEDES